MINILDLPVKIEDRDSAAGTDLISSTFIKERNQVTNHTELLQFVIRWKNMWLLRSELLKQEKDVANLNFNPEVVYPIFKQLLERVDGLDYEQYDVKLASIICCPPVSIHAFIFARQYGVGIDLGFIRLYLDPYPELDDKCRH